MNRQLKLIWDFKGPDAERTAKHHLIHLNEFLERDQIKVIVTGVEAINDMHHLVYLAIEESLMPPVRDALRPNRGQLWLKDS
jgi:hypothetical protein